MLLEQPTCEPALELVGRLALDEVAEGTLADSVRTLELGHLPLQRCQRLKHHMLQALQVPLRLLCRRLGSTLARHGVGELPLACLVAAARGGGGGLGVRAPERRGQLHRRLAHCHLEPSHLVDRRALRLARHVQRLLRRGHVRLGGSELAAQPVPLGDRAPPAQLLRLLLLLLLLRRRARRR